MRNRTKPEALHMENDWKKRLGVVYSTDPGYRYDTEDKPQEETPEPGEQILRISLDRKNRKGKTVTIIEGFRGSEEDLKALEKTLKKSCGAGGSAKNGEILLQGDFREKAMKLLSEKGYHIRRKGGN